MRILKDKRVRIRVNQTRYSEGDVVETNDGLLGIVSEVRTDDEFEGPDGETYEPTSDSPVYIVATESEDTPSVAVRASDLQGTDFPDIGVENPEEQVNGNTITVRANQDGRFQWPESWRESDTPARLIALKAWQGMGGRHGGGTPPTGCVAEMTGEVADPDRFCADFKDRILMWEGWRR
jgi:hypothetical protein